MSETAPFGDPLDLLSALREQLFELRPPGLDAPRYSTLTAAVRAGDLEAITTFLDHGADIDEQTYGSRSPLAAACSSGSEAAVRLLLERGASIEPKLLRSPLIDAARGGVVAVVRRLIEAGASLNWPHGALAVVEAISAGHPAVAEFLVQLEPEIQDAQAWLTHPGMSEFADIVPSVGSRGGDIDPSVGSRGETSSTGIACVQTRCASTRSVGVMPSRRRGRDRRGDALPEDAAADPSFPPLRGSSSWSGSVPGSLRPSSLKWSRMVSTRGRSCGSPASSASLPWSVL